MRKYGLVFCIIVVIIVMWTSTTKAATQPTRAENTSYTTTCAEEDNVNVPIFAPQMNRIRVIATNPTYEIGEDNCEPDFTGCVLRPDGDPPPPDECKRLWDDGTNVVEICTVANWWRPYTMDIVVGDDPPASGHYLVLYRKIQDEPSWPQFLVLYEDGNMRLKPHPPTGLPDVCFGSSVIIGPASPAERPYVDIQEVRVNPVKLSLDITYRDGGTAHLDLSVDRSQAVVEMQVDYDTDKPLVTFRSMWISDENCDAAYIQVKDGDFPILGEWNSLSGPSWFFQRKERSAHNTSAPDIRIEVPSGEVTLDESGPPTWSYTLTCNSGSLTQWSYSGNLITGASVAGKAAEKGWEVSTQTPTLVVFSSGTPLIKDNSLSGFEISGDNTTGSKGMWVAGINSGDIDGPLPVELCSFTALSTSEKIILEWRTETETNNLGFNIYRSNKMDGKYIKVNTKLIAGPGTGAAPHDYSFVDDDVVVGFTYYYYIENVDFMGSRDKSPIIQITVGQDSKVEVIIPPKPKRVIPRQVKEIIPDKFALLQNFPNPFNPETWIPYHLPRNANVTIFLYNANGQLVRTLSVGNRSIGAYVTKASAAYWDGSDNFGQSVASGVYFYTLQAGEFRATRKMVILK